MARFFKLMRHAGFLLADMEHLINGDYAIDQLESIIYRIVRLAVLITSFLALFGSDIGMRVGDCYNVLGDLGIICNVYNILCGLVSYVIESSGRRAQRDRSLRCVTDFASLITDPYDPRPLRLTDELLTRLMKRLVKIDFWFLIIWISVMVCLILLQSVCMTLVSVSGDYPYENKWVIFVATIIRSWYYYKTTGIILSGLFCFEFGREHMTLRLRDQQTILNAINGQEVTVENDLLTAYDVETVVLLGEDIKAQMQNYNQYLGKDVGFVIFILFAVIFFLGKYVLIKFFKANQSLALLWGIPLGVFIIIIDFLMYRIGRKVGIVNTEFSKYDLCLRTFHVRSQHIVKSIPLETMQTHLEESLKVGTVNGYTCLSCQQLASNALFEVSDAITKMSTYF